MCPSQDRTEQIAATLAEIGEVNVGGIKQLAQQPDPSGITLLVNTIAEEVVNFMEDMHGEAAARATAALLEEVSNTTTTDLSGDIERDDHEIEVKTLPGGSTKTTKKRIKGTVKEAVRGLKSTISLSKLLSVDPLMREYLLYCILDVLNAMGARLKLPPDLRAHNVTAERWAEHGRQLAGNTPVKYVLPPDVILGHLRDALGTDATKKRPTPDNFGEGPSSSQEPEETQGRAKQHRPSTRGNPSSLEAPLTHHLAAIFKSSTNVGCKVTDVDLNHTPENTIESFLGTKFDKTHQMGRKK